VRKADGKMRTNAGFSRIHPISSCRRFLLAKGNAMRIRVVRMSFRLVQTGGESRGVSSDRAGALTRGRWNAQVGRTQFLASDKIKICASRQAILHANFRPYVFVTPDLSLGRSTDSPRVNATKPSGRAQVFKLRFWFLSQPEA
jgi:hypothetical protein